MENMLDMGLQPCFSKTIMMLKTRTDKNEGRYKKCRGKEKQITDGKIKGTGKRRKENRNKEPKMKLKKTRKNRQKKRHKNRKKLIHADNWRCKGKGKLNLKKGIKPYSQTRLKRNRSMRHLVYSVRYSVVTNKFLAVNHNVILLCYNNTCL
jgi:hypothetical protein